MAKRPSNVVAFKDCPGKKNPLAELDKRWVILVELSENPDETYSAVRARTGYVEWHNSVTIGVSSENRQTQGYLVKRVRIQAFASEVERNVAWSNFIKTSGIEDEYKARAALNRAMERRVVKLEEATKDWENA